MAPDRARWRLELPSGATLRPWRAGDEDLLAEHANDHGVWRNLRDSFPFPYTRADAEAWIRRANLGTVSHLCIEVDDEPAGGIGLDLQDDVFRRSAEIGYWLGRRFWGRGLATEAVRAVTEDAFGRFDLWRVYAGVFDRNVASARVLEKAGYAFEGRLVRAICKEGEALDQLVFARVR